MDLDASLDNYRSTRRRLEESVLPMATSIDGRLLTFQASLHGLEQEVGGYVVVETPDGPRLSQVLSLEAVSADVAELELGGRDASGTSRASVRIRFGQGTGTVLVGSGVPFHDAPVRPATHDEVGAWLEDIAPRRAGLAVGDLALAPGVPFSLDAGGFDRHTFLCGQSGSGKTYSLGLVLEQIIGRTGLSLVVLDPNSDHVHLGEVRDGTDAAAAARHHAAAAGLAVHRAGAPAAERLRLRLGELDPAAQAALLRLDPVADREEHAALDMFLEAGRPPTVEALLESDLPESRRLAQRVRNLRADRLGIWARTTPGSTLDAVHDPAGRGVVVDVGSLGTREEQSLTAAAVLGSLWRRREDRRPTLVVIDEAHNVCPAEPEDALTALATEYAIRIAAEGRKFGLYLVVATQRPQRVHPNVLTQCDNLVLMRLNSAADLALVQGTFSFAPPGLLALAGGFSLGEALVAGKIAPAATLVRFGRRMTREGGADIPADWASPVA